MQIIADLQLHSKYSRAVSPQMTIPNIAMWAKKKGIGLVATGDWTHPLWIREIQVNLEEIGNGLLKMKIESGKMKDKDNNPFFMLATEVSSIYSQGGKLRRVHTLIWVPTIASAEKINEEMRRRGCNLMADGRPIIGLSCIQVAELVLSIEPKALLIPAHAWTPWFSVFGSLGGFDSLDDAFGSYSKYVYAIETGLSSSPSMNWRIKELDHRSIVSFSDAHSGPKLGREATVFDLKDFSYEGIYQAVTQRSVNSKNPSHVIARSSSTKLTALGLRRGNLHSKQIATGAKSALAMTHGTNSTSDNRIAFTIEFYPEEGKYHYTGHRNCNVKLSPEETIKKGTLCPVCGKKLTEGVMQRVEQLAGRSEESLQLTDQPMTDQQKSENGQRRTDNGVRMIGSKTFPHRPPFVMLVPLQEIISETIGSPVTSLKTQTLYDQLTSEFNGEFSVLLRVKHLNIARHAGDKIAMAIDKVRCSDIEIDPGFDGVFGKVKIWKEELEAIPSESPKEQLTLL